MKDVLMSIKPSWCLCIAIGAKTVELRKNRPRLKTPFKVYIYCTKSSKKGGCVRAHKGGWQRMDGSIIGEFICDEIKFVSAKTWIVREDIERRTAGSCLTFEQIVEYAGWRKAATFMDRKNLYAWHISNLKIYDEPKKLKKPPQNWCYVDSERMIYE
jgi:predicted transcriptional regulator